MNKFRRGLPKFISFYLVYFHHSNLLHAYDTRMISIRLILSTLNNKLPITYENISTTLL